MLDNSNDMFQCAITDDGVVEIFVVCSFCILCCTQRAMRVETEGLEKSILTVGIYNIVR